MSIAEIIKNRLHSLDNKFIAVPKSHGVGTAIDKLNKKVSQCSVEIDGISYDGRTTKPIDNPFFKAKPMLQSNASVNTPLVWRTVDGSLALTVIL